MATLTDPASELSDFADRLTKGSSSRGDAFLAAQFGVDAWSTEFVRIVSCVMERADLVATIVSRSELDPETKTHALDDLKAFKAGFSGASMQNHWNTAGHGMTAMKDHGRPLRYLSATVRSEVSYPKLNAEEVAELLDLIDAYLVELNASDDELDFVRRAITDGLAAFRFQLAHVGWMGAGYVLAAFREVIFTYNAAHSRAESQSLDAGAALMGLAEIITAAKKKFDTAKGWYEAMSGLWKVYKVTSTVAAPLLLAAKMHGGG